MFFANARIRSVAATVLMLFTATACASNDSVAKIKTPQDIKKIVQKKSRYTPEEREVEQRRRMGVIERANTVFTLLGGEMALQKGDAGTALATYMVTLERTKDPVVAERALEMAVSLNAFEPAEMIYQKWRQIEPVPGEAQKRMGWVRNLMMGRADKSLKGLDEILSRAEEEHAKQIFLLLSQAAVQQPDLAAKGASQVHKAAQKYPDMPEASIADAIYSAQSGSDRHAVSALQNLAKLDSEILPPTALTLRLVAQRNPEILSRFFRDTDSKKLSSVWQELEIATLIANKQQDKAYKRLHELLADNPNADLYIQAAYLAGSRREDISVVNGYLEKAYRTGTDEQKSRAAVIGAMGYGDKREFKKAERWVNRITSPEYVFDKAVLKASLQAEQGNGKAALAEARKAQKLPEQQGRFFGSSDLQRAYLFALSKHGNAQEVLSELNALAAKAAKKPDADKLLPDILYQRALVYADLLHQPDKAIADLRRYLKLNPNSAAGMNALGYTMLISRQSGISDTDEAFKLIQTAYNLDPESPAINDSMGWAYYRKGDAQTALPYLQYAFGRYPDSEVAAHLGEVLWQLGQKEEAKKVWFDSLAKGGDVAVLKKTMRRFGVALPASKPAKKPAK